MNGLNKNFINDYKILNTAIIGIECEFFSNYSYIKTLELLNLEFDPIEIWGINKYHSEFPVTENIFKIEPDYSGGSEMIELITGPMPQLSAKIIIQKILNFIQKNGYTNEHSSIHINISFNDCDIKFLNPIKLILNFNEDYIYSKFQNRRNNIYAQSIKRIIPFEDFEDSEIGLNFTIGSLQLPDDTKYYGINLQKKQKGQLEYRYIGGEKYEYKEDYISEIVDYMVLQTKKAILEELNEEDNIKLLSYLDDNINQFKSYKTYDDFLSNIKEIEIEIDKNRDYNVIKMSQEKLYKKLFEIIKSCENIKNATINYNSITNRLEIVNAIINNIHYLNGVDFVECQLTNVTLYNCDIIDCVVETGHIYNCNIFESKITNCKLNNVNAMEWSKLYNCMFDGKFLDCYMENGVFRSGQLGENAQIENNVKMSNKSDFQSIYNPTDKTIKKLK